MEIDINVIETKLNEINKRLERIEDAVYYNGINVEMARLKEKMRLHSWLLTVLVGGIIGIALKVLI